MSQTKAQLIDNLVQPITGADGTQGAPTFSFTDDTDTGLFRPGDNTLGLATGGSTRLTIDSSGRLLFGTTSNSDNVRAVFSANSGSAGDGGVIHLRRGNDASLANTHIGTIGFVDGNGLYATIRSEADTAAGAGDSPGRLTFSTTADAASTPTERIRIDSSGQVGIGVTPAAPVDINFSTNTRLQISNTSSQVIFNARNTANTASQNFRFEATEHLFRTSNSDRLIIDSNGRVGIGTTSPGEEFVVRADAPSVQLESSNASGRTHGIQSNSDGNFFIYDGTAGENRITLNSSGNVGIGTTSPQRLMELSGDRTAILRFTSTRSTESSGQNIGAIEFFGSDTSGPGAGVRSSISVRTHEADGTGSTMRFSTADSTTNNQERLRLGPTGNLALNVTTYSGNQTVNLASDYLASSSNLTNSGLTFQSFDVPSTGDVYPGIVWAGNPSNLARARAAITAVAANANNASHLVFMTRDAADGTGLSQGTDERMRINNAGRVMIGSTSTTSGSQPVLLQVGGGADYFHVERSSGNNVVEVRTEVSITSSRNQYVFRNPNGTVGSITTNGSGTSFNETSDYRLKENVTAVTDGITRLKQLKPSRYNFIADPTKTVDGFIAHEVQDVVPEAVTGEKDAVDNEGRIEAQAIDKSKLVPLLTAALQEAIGRIETLEAEVAALKGA